MSSTPSARPTRRSASPTSSWARAAAHPGAPQERHCTALGKALEAAVRKDFVYDGASHTKIQGVAISAELITELARNHSDLLFVDHQKNAERLAEANRLGELGRKEEMKRIFGIEVP